MATDNGRINVAINSVKAIDYDGPVRGEALAVLEKLRCAEGQWRRKNAQRLDKIVDRLAEQKRAGTGKRQTLSTVADYLDAPDGTVVAKKFGGGFWGKVDGIWEDEQGVQVRVSVLSGAERRVDEWGDL